MAIKNKLFGVKRLVGAILETENGKLQYARVSGLENGN